MIHVFALTATLVISGGLWGNDAALPIQPPLRPIEHVQQPAPVDDPTAVHPALGNPTTGAPMHAEPDFGRQIMHTILALGIIVALLYVLARGVLPRFVKMANRAAGKQISIVERTMLDQKHTLYLVDVRGAGRLLLSASDGDMRLISTVSAAPEHVIDPAQVARDATFSSPKASALRYSTTQSARKSAFAALLFRPSSRSVVADMQHDAGNEVTHGKTS